MTITVYSPQCAEDDVCVGAAVAGIVPTTGAAQARSTDSPTDGFFRDDWFGEPWRNPQAVVLIHGALESGIVWYAWMPTLAKEYRVIRPDLPGCGPRRFLRASSGRSRVSPLTWGACSKGRRRIRAHRRREDGRPDRDAVRRRFPRQDADAIGRQRPGFGDPDTNPSPVPQKDRLGSSASAEMIEYWTRMEKSAPQAGTQGLNAALSSFDLERDGVLQRIQSPSLIITADRSALQSVDKVRKYQQAIRDSRLVVLRSDAYHLAVAKPDECVASVLAFIRENA